MEISGLHNLVGADAGSADSHADNTAVDQYTHALKVGAERTLRVFHNVHTDTALLLGQTATGDVAAEGFVLAANFTDSAHFSIPRTL